MSFKPILKLLKNNQLAVFSTSGALLKPFYKLVFLAAAKEGGLRIAVGWSVAIRAIGGEILFGQQGTGSA